MKVTKKDLKNIGWTAEQLEQYKIECYQTGQESFHQGYPVRIHDNKKFTDSSLHLQDSPVRLIGLTAYQKGYSNAFGQDIVNKISTAIELEKTIQA
jgi:hypothetical protein